MSETYRPHSADGILEVIEGEGISRQRGTSVPVDGTIGYAAGCIYIKTDGGASTTLYVNNGTPASCAFKAVTSAA